MHLRDYKLVTNSLYVHIPELVLDKMDLKKGDVVSVELTNKVLYVKRRR